MGIYVYFSFCLATKRKDTKRKKSSAEAPGLLRAAFSLKGRNSLRSNSLPFFTAENYPPLHAPPLRRDHAVLGDLTACEMRHATSLHSTA